MIVKFTPAAATALKKAGADNDALVNFSEAAKEHPRDPQQGDRETFEAPFYNGVKLSCMRDFNKNLLTIMTTREAKKARKAEQLSNTQEG